MSNYGKSKRVVRTRPGSLRTGSLAPLAPATALGAAAGTGAAGTATTAAGATMVGTAAEPQLMRRYSVSPRMSGRPVAIRGRRESLSPGDVVLQTPHPAQAIGRMPMPSTDKLGRSASMSESNRSGWRSSLVKLMRANSTSGNSGSASVSPKRDSGPKTTQGDDGRISICVIQPTPAASPCTSIRTLCDRRKCFAGTKGQPIDAEMDILPYGSLKVPCVDYATIIDPRCRSTSPRLQTTFGSGCKNSTGELVAQIHQSMAIHQSSFIGGTSSQ